MYREEEAKRTSIAAPTTKHGPINVELKKQGVFDKDYDIIDFATGEPWMLIDTVYFYPHSHMILYRHEIAVLKVGSIFSKEMKYYIKHRHQDQKESTTLGDQQILFHSRTIEDTAQALHAVAYACALQAPAPLAMPSPNLNTTLPK